MSGFCIYFILALLFAMLLLGLVTLRARKPKEKETAELPSYKSI